MERKRGDVGSKIYNNGISPLPTSFSRWEENEVFFLKVHSLEVAMMDGRICRREETPFLISPLQLKCDRKWLSPLAADQPRCLPPLLKPTLEGLTFRRVAR